MLPAGSDIDAEESALFTPGLMEDAGEGEEEKSTSK